MDYLKNEIKKLEGAGEEGMKYFVQFEKDIKNKTIVSWTWSPNRQSPTHRVGL